MGFVFQFLPKACRGQAFSPGWHNPERDTFDAVHVADSHGASEQLCSVLRFALSGPWSVFLLKRKAVGPGMIGRYRFYKHLAPVAAGLSITCQAGLERPDGNRLRSADYPPLLLREYGDQR